MLSALRAKFSRNTLAAQLAESDVILPINVSHLNGADLAALDPDYPHSEMERKLRGLGIVTSGSTEAHGHG